MSRYDVRVGPAARRAIEVDLPEKVAAAVVEFLYGALAESPHRVGKPLRDELTGLWSARRADYRVIYSIEDSLVRVDVVRVTHRRDAYR